MDVLNTPEEHEQYLREVIAPIYDSMRADPSRGISAEEMEAVCLEWDREDGILMHEPLKRSA